jgi:hypothetical protein
MPGAVDLGITDDSERSGHEQATQIVVALFADTGEPLLVASCSVDGTDLAEWLVGNGLAIDWPQYSKGKFDPIQRKAEHERACGRAVMSSRGCTGSALKRAESQSSAPMMQAPTPKQR